MRVLYINNELPPQGCGVASFGLQQAAAMRKLGCDVTVWNSWPPVYLPEDAHTYDVVHINWHPLTTGHILKQHLPKDGPLLSAFIHEYHPHWTERDQLPEIFSSMDILFNSEPVPGRDDVHFMLIPIPDYYPRPTPRIHFEGLPVVIGHTGLRGEGLDRIGPICEKNGWLLSTSKDNQGWVPMEKEVDRLSRCHMVIVHNHSAYAGQASAISTAIAARRPTIINSGRMLKEAARINEEMYSGSQLYLIDEPEQAILTVLADIAIMKEKLPFLMAEDYKWTNQTRRIISLWDAELLYRKSQK